MEKGDFEFQIGQQSDVINNLLQGILKGEVSLYRWPPVW
jgi:hypothetical protein